MFELLLLLLLLLLPLLMLEFTAVDAELLVVLVLTFLADSFLGAALVLALLSDVMFGSVPALDPIPTLTGTRLAVWCMAEL